MEIQPLSKTAVPAAGRLLARAFADDPIITHYLAGTRRRRLAFPAFFRSVLHEHVPLGTVYAARRGGNLIGVAAWAPPDAPPAGPAARALARAARLTVQALFPRSSGALLDGFAATAALHPHEPHWYLAFVGIEPRLQGMGLGSTLLAPVLERADASGVLCYLEAPFPQTHAFYRRLGFEVASESNPFAGAPPLWTMIRRPVGA